MQTATTASDSDLIDLVCTDWEGSRRAHLDGVARTTTISQVVAEAARTLQLPFERAYHALFRGKEISHSDTVGELGISSDEELELVPDVSAGG